MAAPVATAGCLDRGVLYPDHMAGHLPARICSTPCSDVGTAAAAMASVTSQRHDVILLDIGLPGMSGLEVAPELLRLSPHSAVVMLTVLEDRPSVWAAIRAGATGYVSKTAPLDEIVRAIKAAHAGQFLLGSGVAAHIGPPPPPSGYTSMPDLTLRENQLLRLLATGRSTAEMAQRLGITPKTVRNYLSNLYAKLSVEDRAQAALAARQALQTDTRQ